MDDLLGTSASLKSEDPWVQGSLYWDALGSLVLESSLGSHCRQRATNFVAFALWHLLLAGHASAPATGACAGRQESGGTNTRSWKNGSQLSSVVPHLMLSAIEKPRNPHSNQGHLFGHL